MTEQQQGPTLGTDKPEFQMAPLHGRLLARRRETTNVIRGAGSNSA